MTTRRDFLTGAGAASALLLTGSPRARAQQRGMVHDSSLVKDSTNLFAMDQEAAKPVRLPPKAGATASMTPLQRDELERRIHCQCSCTLDVFTCRTTDFSCQVSPAMHRDVMTLVAGGHSAQEILDAFVGVYGERALMAPSRSGFNLLAWLTPGIAVIIAGGILSVLLRRWGRTSSARAAAAIEHPAVPTVNATADELARLDAVVKGDDRA
jgi:cytochrome c-type biogenesis protein CcmH